MHPSGAFLRITSISINDIYEVDQTKREFGSSNIE